jgi:hypothetical protein
MFPPVSHTTDLVAALFDEPRRATVRAEAAAGRPRRTIRRLLGR